MTKLNIHREWFKNTRLGDFGIPNPITNKITRSLNDVVWRNKKMATIRENAEQYVPPETKVITELNEVSTELEVFEKTATDKKGNPFTYSYIVVAEEEYRVPKSVLKELKVQLEEKPESTKFKVKATGSGLNTQYSVVMLD